MRVKINILLYGLFAAAALSSTTPASAVDDMGLDQWQMDRLFSPSIKERAAEQKGQVFIYSGMLDVDVERALDQQFDRIDSMMFVRTIVTDKEGDPVIDKKTGEFVADDDC